jgi:PAS domain S-box-containing protein
VPTNSTTPPDHRRQFVMPFSQPSPPSTGPDSEWGSLRPDHPLAGMAGSIPGSEVLLITVLNRIVAETGAQVGFFWEARDDRFCCRTSSATGLPPEVVRGSIGAEIVDGYGSLGRTEPVNCFRKVTDLAAEPCYPRVPLLELYRLQSALFATLTDHTGPVGIVELLFTNRLSALHATVDSTCERLTEIGQIVSQCRQLDELSRRSEAARHAYLSGQCGSWVLDYQQTEFHPSAEWCRLVGSKPEANHGSLLEWENRVDHRDLEVLREHLFRAARGQLERLDISFRMRCSDGLYRRVLQQSRLERSAAGEPARLVGIHVVLSDAHDADLTGSWGLRAEQVSLLSPAGVFHTGVDGRCQYVNDRWTEISGLSREEALGDGWATALHPGDRERVRLAWQEATRTGQVFRGEYRFVDRKGDVHWVLGQALAVRSPSGEVTGYIGTITDLTDRREMLARVEERERLYQSLVETTDTGFCIVNSVGTVLEANGNYVRLIGRNSLAEVVGRNVLEWTWPGEMERNRREVAATFERGYVRNLRMTYVNGSGERIPIEINATVIHDQAGPRAIAFCRDIRDRIEIEARLEQTAAQLQFLSRRLLEIQENERRNLAQELHDEIGQVLTAVSVNLKSLRHNAVNPLAERLDDSVALVDASIQQVRNLSLDLRPRMLDDLGLVPTLQWFIQRFQMRTGIQVDLELSSQISRFAPSVETTCYRVVQESLSNIARHSGATHAAVRVELRNDTIRLRVADNGSGFNPVEVLDRRRLNPTAGLLGMRERVQLLAGKLTVDSTVGGGTTIAASFPLAEPETLEFKLPEGSP